MDSYVIGVDIGGTFTDAVVVSSSGDLAVGKVPTSPEDFSLGFFDSIEAAAADLGVDRLDLLRRTTRIAHGTTVGINALVTRAVAKVALVATAGHGDAIRAKGGEGRILGATLEQVLDYASSSQADPVVPKDQVYEISERMTRDGRTAAPLTDAHLDALVEAITGSDIESVAISLLWSFINPAHENRVAEALQKAQPGLFICTSHEVAPRIGEYGRTVATVMNAQLGPMMLQYIDRIVVGAQERGFAGEVLFGQAEGGLVSAAEAQRFPLLTLQSGPVANVVGSARAAQQLGLGHIVVADMGGTTLDAALIVDGAVPYVEEAELVRQRVFLRKVDVESIGAGGGSIAWIDELTGTLRVGPHSAGANPGPVCYGRGGTRPTVTDADLVLGVLDPDKPLASGLRLDVDAAWSAFARLGEKIGLGAQECAAGVVEIVDNRMEDLLRRVTVQRGIDPRTMAIWASGGAAGAHAGLFGRGLGASSVVFPLGNVASVWSAYGLTQLVHLRTFQANVNLFTPLDLHALELQLMQLEDQARRFVQTGGGYPHRLIRRAEMKYPLQVYTVDVDLPDREPDVAIDTDWANDLLERFNETYQRRFGPGTGYSGAGAAITALRVTVEGVQDVPTLKPAAALAGPPPEPHFRDVFWGEAGAAVPTPIYDGTRMPAGASVAGPAVMEFPTTTIAARDGQRLTVDQFGNIILNLSTPTEQP
jgi:N-methylhydantoinase A